MPSSWSQRFLTAANNSSPQNPRDARATSRDRPPPSVASTGQDTPTPPMLLGRDGERSMSSSTPPQAHRHIHQRSSSHPLPKFFARKKSTGNLAGYHDTDVPLDEDLVPVLDAPPSASPVRKSSGKKAQPGDDDERVQRRCMCCDSRVKVPKELEKFRCMCCLTINDLIPIEEQKEEAKRLKDGKRSDVLATGAKPSPVAVEQTRNIIDQCVSAYLESRCRKEEDAGRSGQRLEAMADSSVKKDTSTNGIPLRPRDWDSMKELVDAPMSSSPPDPPNMDARPASATIKDFADFSLFAYTQGGTPVVEARPSPHGPGPPTLERRAHGPTSINRRPVPPMDANSDARRNISNKFPASGSAVTSGEPHTSTARLTAEENDQRRHYDRVKAIFRPLEDYIASTFGIYESLNSSFSTVKPAHPQRAHSESNIVTPPPERVTGSSPSPINLSELDAKTLLLGDIGENGTWWTGRLGRKDSDKAFKRKRIGEGPKRIISSKSPNINWAEVGRWYDLVHTAGEDWRSKINMMKTDIRSDSTDRLRGFANEHEIEGDLAEAREHTIRALLKVTENVLKRPTRPLKEPEDLRFVLIILANPSLYPSALKRRMPSQDHADVLKHAASSKQKPLRTRSPNPSSPRKLAARAGSQHTGILKRVYGLLACASEACHRYLITWFSRFDEDHFVRIVDLAASFVTHRISRKSSRSHAKNVLADGGLIPDLSGSALNTSAQLHSAMGLSGSFKRPDDPDQEPSYAQDWQVKAAAKVMSLLFTANNIWQGRRRAVGDRIDSGVGISPEARARRSGQLLHTSSFYNTLLDYQDMIQDFKVWETKRDRFAFCQYPFFLSMGTKIKILEYDARRQMESKAREAYFDSVIRQREMEGYFHLRVRRDCMVDDSLRQISQAVGAGQEELKKGLRVHFTGEEGVDAGGLRKEWFLMLVRDIFDPNHGLFVYDDESHTCYFNPNSFETSDQYYLVGALLGLAIYNSTILDIALPPFAFRKLLAAAPTSSVPKGASSGPAAISSLTGTKGQMTYNLSDLAEFRPSLAAGLQQLLDFEGDVQETYCRDFVAPVERYGIITNVPLIPNGASTPVTNSNRAEFVETYIRYLLDTAVSKQFEPFKRGFFQVCAGNALSLFRAEEIELLVRGSDEALDIDSLRAVAVYENWRHIEAPHAVIQRPADHVDVVRWFWDIFASATPERQRKLLTFVTGTDRIPAVGATNLVLRIVAGGDGWGGGGEAERGRFPVARTCFNMLILYRYESREQLEGKLWRAVEESEGFGLK